MKNFVLVILSLLVVGCSNLAPEEKELIGQWVTYGAAGGPSNIKTTRIELEILPDHTYSYFTPALQGYGYSTELIDIPAMQRYGRWQMGKSSYWQTQVEEDGFWEACCLCTTPEYDEGGDIDIGSCDPYILEGDKLTTLFATFPIPFLGDVIFPVEWTRIKQ
jgi:hypothetical protein